MQSEESKLLDNMMEKDTEIINKFFEKVKIDTFADCLNELLMNKKWGRSDLYNELSPYLSRAYIYELGTFAAKNGKKLATPSRQVVMAIGIAIGATQEDMNRLLKCAGYVPLNKRDREDFDVIRGINQNWEKERLYATIKLSEKKDRKS